MNPEEFDEEREEAAKFETLSGGDFEDELDTKLEFARHRDRPKFGIFEKTAYFDRIFPSLKIQKPGADYYGSTTVVTTFMALYLFAAYSYMSVDPDALLKITGSTIFNGDMAVILFMLMALIIFERYANRSDTKAIENTLTNSKET